MRPRAEREPGSISAERVAGQTREVLATLDAALTDVFSESGKQTILYYLSGDYSLTLEDAANHLTKLEESLTSLLGESGWIVVKRKIVEQFERLRTAPPTPPATSCQVGEGPGFLRSLSFLPV